MFEDSSDSPIVNRCGTHTVSLIKNSLVKHGFGEIDKKLEANGYKEDQFFKDLILLFYLEFMASNNSFSKCSLRNIYKTRIRLDLTRSYHF